MTGHNAVLNHRLSGQLLRANTLWVKTEADAKSPQDWARYGEFAQIAIEPSDYPELLDLRFAHGLVVKVEGTDAERVDQVAQAFIAVQAGRVLTTVYSSNGVRAEVVRMTDTEGVVQWSA